MRGIALVSFALIIAMPTLAETFTPQQINALNNLQEEYTTCGYYYRLQIACAPPGEGKEKLKSQLDPILTVCEQRLRRVAADMGRITNNNCVNMDSLAARYQTRCKQLIENPDAILDELRK